MEFFQYFLFLECTPELVAGGWWRCSCPVRAWSEQQEKQPFQSGLPYFCLLISCVCACALSLSLSLFPFPSPSRADSHVQLCRVPWTNSTSSLLLAVTGLVAETGSFSPLPGPVRSMWHWILQFPKYDHCCTSLSLALFAYVSMWPFLVCLRIWGFLGSFRRLTLEWNSLLEWATKTHYIRL